MTALTLTQLTEGTLEGSGIFDKLMQATKAHLDAEFKKGAIKGPEYSQVYLGQVQAVLNTALQFLSNQQKIGLEADLLAKQIALADKQLVIADAQLAQTQAQTALVNAQITAIAVDKDLAQANADRVRAETLNVPKEGLRIEAQTALVTQQQLNEVQQNKVLIAQECLLKAQFDNTTATVLKTNSETSLLNQKMATEKAQILELGVDENSVVGRQKALYMAQTEGFKRDAEQKGAKLLIDSWNVRRTTDEGTVADGTNKLYDLSIGRAVDKLLAGMGA